MQHGEPRGCTLAVRAWWGVVPCADSSAFVRESISPRSCDTMLALSPCPHCHADWSIIGSTQAIARGGTDSLAERIGSAC